MAIYHMQAKVVSRGSGRSAVAASAYMSCSRMYNDYDGIQHDYTRKQGLIYQEVMLPPMAPLEWNDREQLWNAVEETEKTKDSRLAREFVVALPVELDKDSNISLLQDFIKKNFVDMGMCADFAIHDTDGHNPHAHILLTVRPLNENGTWQYKTEKEYLCIKDGEEKGVTASEFKTAQKQGWEKQYRYKVGKKKEYLTSSVAQEKGYERIDKHPKSSRYGRQNPARVNPRPKKIDFFVPSNITSHYTCYCSILKAIFILAEERSATFSRHSKLCNHPSYLKNGSSVFHIISILSSPLIITFLITFWIFSLSKDSILMILSNCVSNLLEELSSGGISVLSCSIS